MKEALLNIIGNTSLWEIMVLFAIIYSFFRPELWRRITKLKVGDFEVELKELKEEVKKGTEKIDELESELESERRQFEELLDSFDANAPIRDLAKARQAIKSQANNISEVELFKKYMTLDASHEELFTTAVGIREKRPVILLPDLVNLLDQLADDKKLGDYRLNTIWTLTSAVHKILISTIRDGVTPFPNMDLLNQAEHVLNKLDQHPKVLMDRPDNPMKGIKGPIKHSLSWIQKGKEKMTAT